MTPTTEPDFKLLLARADDFRDEIADAIDVAVAAVDCASPCAEAVRRELRRIGSTLNAVSVVTWLNLRTLDVVTNGAVMATIRAKLLSAGSGPSLDTADAAAFLADFQLLTKKLRGGRLN